LTDLAGSVEGTSKIGLFVGDDLKPLRHTKFAAWFSLAVYLIASGFGVAHGAEYGDEAHQHNGHACAVQAFVDEVEHGRVAHAPAAAVPDYAPEAHATAPLLRSNDTDSLGYKSRAPPAIS